MRVMITVYVPEENADDIRRVLGEAGAGQLGKYSYCSFSTVGVGRSTPSEDADPHIGTPGLPETIVEQKVEVICDRDKAKEAIRLMKQAHPYEEVAFNIVPVIEESDL